jgi:hypothetical protein
LRNYETGLDPNEFFLKAKVEPNQVLPIFRDPWCFGYVTRTEGSDLEMISKSNGMHTAQRLLHWFISGLTNFTLKGMVDVNSSDGKKFLWAMKSTDVFFTTGNT